VCDVALGRRAGVGQRAPLGDSFMDAKALTPFVAELWDREITPALVDYIRIPAKSPAFDADWAKNGFIDQAVEHMAGWAREKIKALPGSTLEVVRLEGRTPVILIEAPGEVDDTVLLYGHLDKQPEMVGWSQGLGPWEPVIKDDKLYGRGGADDGYAIYASVTALLALQNQSVKRARCVVLIEACEESGSYDLPHYVDHLADQIGAPSLVICLDSGCGNYDQMWLTTSLRGMTAGRLKVQVLEEGVHSGDASGVVPDSFRIARALLSRVEDAHPRHRRVGAEPHLAATADGHRSRRSAAAGRCGQRPAPGHDAGAQPAPAAHRRCSRLRKGHDTGSHRRPTAGRLRDLREHRSGRRLERPAAGAVAGGRRAARVAGDLRA